MRRVVFLVLLGMVLADRPVDAQVINGEGTYEGSSMHQPPDAVPDEPRGQAKPRPKGTSGEAPSDMYDRHD